MTTTTDATAKAEAATLAGVTTTTPAGDAKQQEREAKRAALAAKKADIAAKAAAAQAKATTPAAPAPTPSAPAQGAGGAAEATPSTPEPTPRPATPQERLTVLLAEAKTVKAFRDGIAAVLADMAKPPTRASGGNGGSAKAAELEAAMLKAMAKATEAAPITLQDTMRAIGADMKDAKPYNAMKRLVSDGRVTVAKTTAPKAYFVTATK